MFISLILLSILSVAFTAYFLADQKEEKGNYFYIHVYKNYRDCNPGHLFEKNILKLILHNQT